MADHTNRGWSRALRLVLALLAVSTIGALHIAIRERRQFLAAFPGAADPRLYALFLLTALTGLVALVGVWRWRRWGIFLFFVTSGMSVALDGIARAPRAHQIAVVLSAAVVLTLCWRLRIRFSP